MLEAIILESRELLIAFTAAVSFASGLIVVTLLMKRSAAGDVRTEGKQ